MKTTMVRGGGNSLAVHCSGDGPPIVLCHGNSCSSRCYWHQLEGRLARRFRLIAVDLPGHGDSEPASSPAASYTLPGYAAALVEAAGQLDARSAVFVGWSLGGHVVLEASAQLPIAAGFLVFGSPPVSSSADFPAALSTHPALQAGFREDSTEREIDECLSLFFKPGTLLPDAFREDFRRTDKRARSSLAASLARNEFLDEVRIVAGLDRPIAVLHGRFDSCVQRNYLDQVPFPTLWRGRIQEVPDAGHAPQWETVKQFDSLLEDFVIDCMARA